MIEPFNCSCIAIFHMAIVIAMGCLQYYCFIFVLHSYFCVFFYRKLERYTSYFKDLKGLRTLEWKTHLGLVQVSEISMIHIVHFDSDSNGTPHPAVPSVDIKLILY